MADKANLEARLAFQQMLDDEPEIARQMLVRLCDPLREAESE